MVRRLGLGTARLRASVVGRMTGRDRTLGASRAFLGLSRLARGRRAPLTRRLAGQRQVAQLARHVAQSGGFRPLRRVVRGDGLRLLFVSLAEAEPQSVPGWVDPNDSQGDLVALLEHAFR